MHRSIHMMGAMMENLPNGNSVSGDRCVPHACNRAVHEWTERDSDDVPLGHKQRDLWRAVRMFCEQVIAKAEQNVRDMKVYDVNPADQRKAVDENAYPDIGSGPYGRRTDEANVHLSTCSGVSDRCANEGDVHPTTGIDGTDRCKDDVDPHFATFVDVTDRCTNNVDPRPTTRVEITDRCNEEKKDAEKNKELGEEEDREVKEEEKEQVKEDDEEKEEKEEVEEGKVEDKEDSHCTTRTATTEQCTNERNPHPTTCTDATDQCASEEDGHPPTYTDDRRHAEESDYPYPTTCTDATAGSHRRSAGHIGRKGVRTSQSLKLRPEHYRVKRNLDSTKQPTRHRSMELCGSKTRQTASPPALQTLLTRGTTSRDPRRTTVFDSCATSAPLREYLSPPRDNAHTFDMPKPAPALSPRVASGCPANKRPRATSSVAEEEGYRLISSGGLREEAVEEFAHVTTAARGLMKNELQKEMGIEKWLAFLDEMDDSTNPIEMCEAIRACRSRVDTACRSRSNICEGVQGNSRVTTQVADSICAQELVAAFDVAIPSGMRVATSHTDISSTTPSSPKPQAVFQPVKYGSHRNTAHTSTQATPGIPRSHTRGRNGRAPPPAPLFARWDGPPASSSRVRHVVSSVLSHGPHGHEELECAAGRYIEPGGPMENNGDYKATGTRYVESDTPMENKGDYKDTGRRYRESGRPIENKGNYKDTGSRCMGSDGCMENKDDYKDLLDMRRNVSVHTENQEMQNEIKDNDNIRNNATRCSDQYVNDDKANNCNNRIYALAKDDVRNEDEAGVRRLIAHRDRCIAANTHYQANVEKNSAPNHKHFAGFMPKPTPPTPTPQCVNAGNLTDDYASGPVRGKICTVDELYAPFNDTRYSSPPLLYKNTTEQRHIRPGPAIYDTRNSRDHTAAHVAYNEQQFANDAPLARQNDPMYVRDALHIPSQQESRVLESSPPREHQHHAHAPESQTRIGGVFHPELSETGESRHGVPRVERIFSPASPQKKTDNNVLRKPEDYRHDIHPVTVHDNVTDCPLPDPFASLYAVRDPRTRRALAPPTQPTRAAALQQQVDCAPEEPYYAENVPPPCTRPGQEPCQPLSAEIEDDEVRYIEQAHREVAALYGGYRFDSHEIAFEDLLTDFDYRRALQKEEYELIQQRRQKSDEDILMMYCDAILYNQPLTPELQDFESRQTISFTDEHLAMYLVQKVVGDVILAQTEIEWTETHFADHVWDVETDRDISYLENSASSSDIFNFWAFLLDDLYVSVILPAIQQDADPRGRIESDIRVRHLLESPFCVASLIQFVVLIEPPHSCQELEEAVLRSKVALDILILQEFANLIFNNQLLRISDIMFMCFSSIESKTSGQKVVSNHVTGLISYIYSIATDDVISFVHNFHASMYMLAYYIDLPGVADLCLRLLLQTTDLRPVRLAGQITEPYFLEFMVHLKWFPYLINVMNSHAPESTTKPKETAILQFLSRFFEICEIYFRSLQKEAITSTHLYSLVHYVAVETGLTRHLLEMGMLTGSMDAINVVLAILKIHPLVEGSADQIGCVLHSIFRPEMTVASPNRSRDDPEKNHDQWRALKTWSADGCRSYKRTRVGAFECAQLQIIKVHLEEVKSLAWVPHDYWFLFQWWYLEREKRNHVCHPILFAIWKSFVLYAPIDAVSEVLPPLIRDCMDIIFAENWKDWCDVVKEQVSQRSHAADGESTRVTHSVRFTSVARRTGGLGTMLQFILFAGERKFLAERGIESSKIEMKIIRRVMGSVAFGACHQRAKEIQETTARATATVLEKKRRPPSTSPTDPTVEPCEAEPLNTLNDPPSISPPEPPQQEPVVVPSFDDSPALLVETRTCSTLEARKSFKSGVCRLSNKDSWKCARRYEASSSKVVLSDISAELEAAERLLHCRQVAAAGRFGISGSHHDESIDAPLSSEEIPSPTSTATPPHSSHSDTHSSHSPTDAVHDHALDTHLAGESSPRSDVVTLALEGFVSNCGEHVVDAIPLHDTKELSIEPEKISDNELV
eukprot:GEMP01000648.1.p1 GENE.GEMP01000648.1~~GEMP01000648.1.p1  ORF type:complete len:2014 (+),score=399.18 GEMP01000648.1:92-6133(+)